MRTDEEMLTFIALREIPCPCEKNCAEQERFHDSIPKLMKCLAVFQWPRMNDLLRIYEMSRIVPDDLKELMGKRTNVAMSVFTALEEVGQRYKLYACKNREELDTVTAREFWGIMRGVFQRCHDASVARFGETG